MARWDCGYCGCSLRPRHTADPTWTGKEYLEQSVSRLQQSVSATGEITCTPFYGKQRPGLLKSGSMSMAMTASGMRGIDKELVAQ